MYHQITMLEFTTFRRSVIPAALAIFLLQGCSQVRARGNGSANAPGIAEGGEPHIRGVSDPNAPFTLVDRSHASTQQPSLADPASVPGCDPSSLQVYEAAASISGSDRRLRLAFKNLGATDCRLSGTPLIALQDDSGATLANIAVRQTSESSVAGTVAAPEQAVAFASAQSVNVVLRPSGEASFEIYWVSGDDCPLVAHIAIGIALPGEAKAMPANSFSISHLLRVCGGEVHISPLLPGSSV